MAQPGGLFQCHQNNGDDLQRIICAGWSGCHDGDELLALRLAVTDGRIAPERIRLWRTITSSGVQITGLIGWPALTPLIVRLPPAFWPY
ncbi:DUF6283 family protein [Amycolatopsis magusensis]|uniref:DUF6283 family protein n=1 Tax=Amycolatopsis magusensis TaxID=882444 RepID=UPI0034D3D26B